MRAYWLADRPIGVRTFQLEVGWATETAVQRDIILDLEKNRVKWLLIDLESHSVASFDSRGYRGSCLLDDYIRDHYRQEALFGPYAVLTTR
jgi:hypothetical protein